MGSFLKKIIYIILFAGLYYVLVRYADVNTVLRHIRFSYSHPLLIFISIIIDPIVGGLANALGVFFTFFESGKNDWIELGCAFVNCAGVGFSMRKVDIAHGFFQRKDWFYFTTVLIIFDFVCWMLLYPFLNYFIFHSDLRLLVNDGFWKAFNLSLSGSVLTTLFLALYARTRITAANFYRN